eukprot:GFYU01003165.1.p1 GENE.GFYU01003165.1~~GFYU01003165.1.p1  ORF type:complete len:302 (-),score=52.28 GFYU01003165.1:337-1242(-)
MWSLSRSASTLRVLSTRSVTSPLSHNNSSIRVVHTSARVTAGSVPFHSRRVVDITPTGLISGSAARKYHQTTANMKFLNQKESIELDETLMGPLKYTIDQLMELAGLSVASAVHQEYSSTGSSLRVCVICGPGNNGGDGLVAARHLVQFGHSADIYYPKRPAKELYQNLVHQADYSGVGFLEEQPSPDDLNGYNVIVDAIFGFSFKGAPRAPFDTVLNTLKTIQTPVFAVDIPSGWDVEQGNINEMYTPAALISLSAPKQGASKFEGAHYLGGRFIPKKMVDDLGLDLPTYPGTAQCVKLQ